jgi:hypothetical protein
MDLFHHRAKYNLWIRSIIELNMRHIFVPSSSSIQFMDSFYHRAKYNSWILSIIELNTIHRFVPAGLACVYLESRIHALSQKDWHMCILNRVYMLWLGRIGICVSWVTYTPLDSEALDSHHILPYKHMSTLLLPLNHKVNDWAADPKSDMHPVPAGMAMSWQYCTCPTTAVLL